MIEILKDYRGIVREIKQINDEIERLKDLAITPRRAIITGVPKGTPAETDKMASLMAQFEELEEKYNELLANLLIKQRTIEDAIETLEPREKELIRYRYIDGLPWHKIQIKCSYAQRTVFRIHESALKKLEKMTYTDT